MLTETRAVELVERLADLRRLADEDRRVALGVAARLGLAQRQHQVHEVGRLVALEGGHELLVVDPERVRRVVVDRRELVRRCACARPSRAAGPPADSAYHGRTFTNG